MDAALRHREGHIPDFMAELDRDFQAATGLQERRLYKIFYSHVHPFPLLVLGLNPGGAADGSDLSASQGFYEQWEHDYVSFRRNPRYPLAGPACDLLFSALGTKSRDALRQVPVSNVIFRRSRNSSELDIFLVAAANESRPFVERILKFVNPKAILFVSGSAFDLFLRHHSHKPDYRPDLAQEITAPNGRTHACIFRSGTAFLPAPGRDAALFVVGHPSKYSSRSEWPNVVDALRGGFRRIRLSPVESTGALIEVPALAHATVES